MGIDYIKLEKLVRIISDLKNQDKDVVLDILRCNRCWFEVVRDFRKSQRQHHSDRHVQQLDRDSS